MATGTLPMAETDEWQIFPLHIDYAVKIAYSQKKLLT